GAGIVSLFGSPSGGGNRIGGGGKAVAEERVLVVPGVDREHRAVLFGQQTRHIVILLGGQAAGPQVGDGAVLQVERAQHRPAVGEAVIGEVKGAIVEEGAGGVEPRPCAVVGKHCQIGLGLQRG